MQAANAVLAQPWWRAWGSGSPAHVADLFPLVLLMLGVPDTLFAPFG